MQGGPVYRFQYRGPILMTDGAGFSTAASRSNASTPRCSRGRRAVNGTTVSARGCHGPGKRVDNVGVAGLHYMRESTNANGIVEYVRRQRRTSRALGVDYARVTAVAETGVRADAQPLRKPRRRRAASDWRVQASEAERPRRRPGNRNRAARVRRS